MIEIPKNTYRIESSPRVERLAKWVTEAFKTYSQVTVLNSRFARRTGPREDLSDHYDEDESFALEVGRAFSEAGYYVGVERYVTGFFNYMVISKTPFQHGYSTQMM